MKNDLIVNISDVTYRKGVEYFADKKVENVHQINDSEYEGDVRGSELYHVHLNINDLSLSTCTCPHFASTKKICKHMVAVYLSIYPELAEQGVEVYRASLPKPKERKVAKPKVVKKTVEEVDPLKEKDKRAKKITRQYQLTPVPEDVVLTTTYDGKEYTYHPFLVGQRIKKLRLEKKFSKEYLAKEYFDLTASDISLWEVGKLPSLEDLDYLAWVAFDTSLYFLLTGEPEPDEVFEEDEEEVEEEEPQEVEQPVDIERQKNVELGKHVVLEFNSLDDYEFYKDELLNKVSLERYFPLKNYSRKVFQVEFSKKTMYYKKYLKKALTIKLVYGIEFQGDTLYLLQDKSFTPLTKKYLPRYVEDVERLCEFDIRLSKLVNCSEEDIDISNKLNELKETLSKLNKKNHSCVEVDDVDGYDFIWDHNVSNPKNVEHDYAVSLPYSIKEGKVVDENGDFVAFLDDYDHKIFKAQVTYDKKTGSEKIKLKYGICFNDGEEIYLHSDPWKKLLTVNTVVEYLEILKQIISFDKQISSSKEQSVEDETITDGLQYLYEFLETFEGFSREDKKYNKQLRKIANAQSMNEYIFIDEIWGD